ncbi:hypothetical protein SS1G_04033 [Sclerotinia sclerotiorum 1980 UF-70]|uniref:N-alpha-acetyltransferase 40 n=2 Tax=Sclerotinia sclerotiorum (strain ATCC 18683 / 1980 / Ss-1) TaxID=665079 RepID=A7EFE2_SCLS1|nr:hypothetical protein SS1G_04033 [Sclerotinia sclerotiorum 1980 UF-70]APA07233.1 hypothetical protein sscle_02g020030 [Sclerotinia sclerotiorum 1980 UF-70]EDO01558.1 hypothetical protein SS1G_04033 [Sclerotinia sclerotiorum 1980 UF-70]
MSTQDLDLDPITTACAKSLEDFERDYMPPRSSYALYTPPPKKDVPAKSYKIDLYKADTLHAKDLTACLNLIEKTSGRHYRGSKLGWNGMRKRREMGLLDLRYLVVRESVGGGAWEDVDEGEDVCIGEAGEEEKGMIVQEQEHGKEKREGEIKGFMSFMPTFEDGFKVIYLYEIHLPEELRSTGLGTHLMTLLTSISRAIPGVEKIMLTCFVANKEALGFYKKFGFEIDEYSPEPKRLKGGRLVQSDYVILSRRVEGEGVEGGGEREEAGEWEEREAGRG